MKPKMILSGALLLFVAVSIGVMIGQATGGNAAREPASGATEASRDTQGAAPAVIAYYYHGTGRCMTCNTIETYAAETIQSDFADELKDGRLEWRTANYEKPENEHVFDDYDLVSSSLVLVAPGKTGPDSYRVLTDVWYLTGDREAFSVYVRDELARFMNLNAQGG